MKIAAITIVIGFVALFAAGVQAQNLPTNVRQLTEAADRIFTGKVMSVEGTVNSTYPNVDLTAVTVRVSSVMKQPELQPDLDGKVASGLTTGQNYTFTMFGSPNSIYELPSFHSGEVVMLFLYRDSEYGLTSPVGGEQGKFTILPDGTAVNEVQNATFLYNMKVPCFADRSNFPSDPAVFRGGPVPLEVIKAWVQAVLGWEACYRGE
jgi:hypothetical protein